MSTNTPIAPVTEKASAPAKENPSHSAPVVPQRRGSRDFDLLLRRITRHVGEESATNFVGFVGSERKVGTSLMACNIAIRAADHRLGPVLLVDANTQTPKQHRNLRVKRGPGLAELLTQTVDFGDAIQATKYEGLSLLSAGKRAKTLVAPVTADGMQGLVQELRERFAWVIFDFPAGEQSVHWVALLQQLDALMLVLGCNQSTRATTKQVLNQFESDGVAITGSVFNRFHSHTPSFLRRR